MINKDFGNRLSQMNWLTPQQKPVVGDLDVVVVVVVGDIDVE